MSFVYTEAKRRAAIGQLILDGTHDIRCALLMTNTTADTEEDVLTLATITTLDEYNGAGYARQALAGEVVTADGPNNRSLFDAVDPIFAALGAGVRSAQGLLLFRQVTNDADSFPIAWYDAAPFPVNGNGLDLTIRINAAGLLAFT